MTVQIQKKGLYKAIDLEAYNRPESKGIDAINQTSNLKKGIKNLQNKAANLISFESQNRGESQDTTVQLQDGNESVLHINHKTLKSQESHD